MALKPATKKNSKLRTALYGPAGAGKTYGALRIASGIGGRIAFIDSERKTACKYAGLFTFDVNELDDRSVESYIAAIQEAVDGGYSVLIIDSISHAWQELLQEIDLLANTQFNGNRWAAWAKGTPLQHRFVDAMLTAPIHIIATMRAKTEWEKGDGGKPKRVGLAPEQRGGIEFEFDQLIQLSQDNTAFVEKDRSGKFQGKVMQNIDERFGADLAHWLSDGEVLPPPAKKPAAATAPSEAPGQRAASGPSKVPNASWPAEGECTGVFDAVRKQPAGHWAVHTVGTEYGDAWLRADDSLGTAINDCPRDTNFKFSFRKNGSALDIVIADPVQLTTGTGAPAETQGDLLSTAAEGGK